MTNDEPVKPLTLQEQDFYFKSDAKTILDMLTAENMEEIIMKLGNIFLWHAHSYIQARVDRTNKLLKNPDKPNSSEYIYNQGVFDSQEELLKGVSIRFGDSVNIE